jgi:UDP-glucose 4-epimerase
MKVLVFGGSGLLGSHVVDVLTKEGHETAIFDIRKSPYLQKGQEMIIGDILDRESVEKAARGRDAVYNFAGIADIGEAYTKPIETVENNIGGTTIILEACRKHAVKRFVFASTIYVYSDKGGFYRCSKQAAELYTEEYARNFGLDYTVLRYGTVYGPRADSRNSMYCYLKQAIENEKIVCSGTGDEIREYIHVKDAARLSVSILSDEYRNQHVIITGHHSMRFEDMLHMVREILGNRVEIEFTGAIDESHYNITPYSFVPKIGRKLVDHCYVDMGQGLLECINEIYNSKPGGEKSVR